MAVKIRLARGGAKKKPFYRIVIANHTASRDGKFIEKVGTYNPMLQQNASQKVVLNEDKISYWLSKGAIPTDRVAIILEKSNIELPKFVLHKLKVKKATRTKKSPKKDKAA